MRILIALAVLAAAMVPGCAGGPNPEQQAEQQRKLDELRLYVDQKLADLEKRYANVLQMEQRVKNAVEEAEKMSKVNDVVRRLLAINESALKDQLRTVQELIKDFKQP